MAIQGIINGFADPQDTNKHVILIGRGAGYSLVVNGQQSGEQESTIETGLSALAIACRDRPKTWNEVRGTSTSGETGELTVTELGSAVMDDFELRV